MRFSKLTKPELDYLLENANFTEEEEKIFRMLSKGKSRSQVGLEISVSDSTIDRRIRDIKSKIARVGDGICN
jgi:DNA-binding NarL/FixJ family response regulator